jgi:hypothetical protein
MTRNELEEELKIQTITAHKPYNKVYNKAGFYVARNAAKIRIKEIKQQLKNLAK